MRGGGKALAVLALGTLATWMAMAIGVSVWRQVLVERGRGEGHAAAQVSGFTCRLPRR
jgi:hypothetical protein